MLWDYSSPINPSAEALERLHESLKTPLLPEISQALTTT